MDTNHIQIRIYRDGGDTYIEKEYEIPVGATVYVDSEDGSDTEGSSSSSYPWKTIAHALSQIAGTSSVVSRKYIDKVV